MAEALSLADFLTLPPREQLAAGISPPATGSVTVDAAEFSRVRYGAPSGYRVREVRGSRMRTVAALFDEFAAALQFPYYFRPNKDAFDECLFDLADLLGDASGYVVAVRDAEQLLADVPQERKWFDSVIAECAGFWISREVAFRVVLQGAPVGLTAVPVRL
ncbi:barstar family protein [Nocardia sp. NBC_01329]|uniref:barstar family protein n=1 Tax=Nocardia sp. NBC_01329 TaxID=2903594 RepID=UPI002E0E30B5|nr:barstar family protein [Nocardia sp. NBC_01329]